MRNPNKVVTDINQNQGDYSSIFFRVQTIPTFFSTDV